ncbi:unnamed protein product [Lampetra fluviatilis]
MGRNSRNDASEVLRLFPLRVPATEVWGAANLVAGFRASQGRTTIVGSFLSGRAAFSFATWRGAAHLGPALSCTGTTRGGLPVPGWRPRTRMRSKTGCFR